MNNINKSNKIQSNQQLTSQIQEESSGQMQQQKQEKQLSNTPSNTDAPSGSKDKNQQDRDFGGVGSLNQSSNEFKNPVQKQSKASKNNSQQNLAPPSPSKKKQKQQNLSKNMSNQQMSPEKGEGPTLSAQQIQANKAAMVFGSWYDKPQSSNKEQSSKGGKHAKNKKSMNQKDIEKLQLMPENKEEIKDSQTNPNLPVVNDDHQISPNQEHHTEVSNDADIQVKASPSKIKHKDLSLNVDAIIPEEQKQTADYAADSQDKIPGKIKNRIYAQTPKDSEQQSSQTFDPPYKEQPMTTKGGQKQGAGQYDSWSTKNQDNYGGHPNQPPYHPDQYDRRGSGRQLPPPYKMGNKPGFDQQYYGDQQYQPYYQDKNQRGRGGFKQRQNDQYDHNYSRGGYNQQNFYPPPYARKQYYDEYDANYDRELQYQQKNGSQTDREMHPSYNELEYSSQQLEMQKQNSGNGFIPQPQIQHKKKKAKHNAVIVSTNNNDEPVTKSAELDVKPQLADEVGVQDNQQAQNNMGSSSVEVVEERIKEELKMESTPAFIQNTTGVQPQPQIVDVQASQVVEVKQKLQVEQTAAATTSSSQKKKKKQNKGNAQVIANTQGTEATVQGKQDTKQKESDPKFEEKREEKKEKQQKPVPSTRKEALQTQAETAVNRLHMQRSKSLTNLPKHKKKQYQQKEKEEEKQLESQIPEFNVNQPGLNSDKKIHKLDPDVKKGNPVLVVIAIQTRERIVEATIREGTNINFLSDKIAVLADFKNCPKKFKEIFQCYLKNQYTSALTQKQIQIILGNNPQQLQFQNNLEALGNYNGNSGVMNSATTSQIPNNIYQQQLMGSQGLYQYGQLQNNIPMNPYQTDEQQKQHLINRLQQSINAMPEYESPLEHAGLLHQYSQLSQHISQAHMAQQIHTQSVPVKQVTPEKTMQVQQRSSDVKVDIVNKIIVEKAQSVKSGKSVQKRCISLPSVLCKERGCSTQLEKLDQNHDSNLKKRKSFKNVSSLMKDDFSPKGKKVINIQNFKSSPASQTKDKLTKSELKKKKSKDQSKNKEKSNTKSVNFLEGSKQDNNKQSSRENFQEAIDLTKFPKMENNQNFYTSNPNPLFGPPLGDQKNGQMRFDQQTSMKNTNQGLVSKENLTNTGMKIGSQGNYLQQAAQIQNNLMNNLTNKQANQNILHQNHQGLTNLQGNMNGKTNASIGQMNPGILPFQQNYNITVPQISPFQQMQTAMGNPTQATGFNPNHAAGLIPHHNNTHLVQNKTMQTQNQTSIHNQYQIPHQAHQKSQYNNQFQDQNNSSFPNSFNPNSNHLDTSLEKLQNQIKHQIGNMINSNNYQQPNQQPLNQLNGQPLNPLQQSPFQQLDYSNQNSFYGSQWNNQMLPMANQMNQNINHLPLNNQTPIGINSLNSSMPLPLNYQTGTNFQIPNNQAMQTPPMKVGTQEVGAQSNHTQNSHKTQRQNNTQMSSNLGMQNQNSNSKTQKNSNSKTTQGGSKNNSNTTSNVGPSGSNGLPMDGSQQRSVQLVTDSNSQSVVSPNNLNNQQLQTNGSQQLTTTPTNFGASQGQESTQLSQSQLSQAQHQSQFIQNLVFVFQMGDQNQPVGQGISDPNQLQMMQQNPTQNLIERGNINARASGMLGTNTALPSQVIPQQPQQHLEQRNQEMSRGNPNYMNQIMTNNQHPQSNVKTQKQHSQINKNSNSDQAHHRRQEVARDQPTTSSQSLNTNEQRQGYSSQYQDKSPPKQI